MKLVILFLDWLILCATVIVRKYIQPDTELSATHVITCIKKNYLFSGLIKYLYKYIIKSKQTKLTKNLNLKSE